jgi:hypothetical protein
MYKKINASKSNEYLRLGTQIILFCSINYGVNILYLPMIEVREE